MSHIYIYIYTVYPYIIYIYTVDKLLTSTMYEKMDGKGIPLWFRQSVRQSPGQSLFSSLPVKTSWDARRGFGQEFLKVFYLLGTISTKTPRETGTSSIDVFTLLPKKKTHRKPPFSCNSHAIPTTFIPGRDAGAQNISTGQMTKGCQLQTRRRFHPYVAQRYLRKAQKSGRNLMNFWR